MLASVADEQPPAGGETDTETDGPNWSRVLDVAGVVAGVALAAIVVDIWTDGRLISRRIAGRGGGEPEPEETGPPDE